MKNIVFSFTKSANVLSYYQLHFSDHESGDCSDNDHTLFCSWSTYYYSTHSDKKTLVQNFRKIQCFRISKKYCRNVSSLLVYAEYSHF